MRLSLGGQIRAVGAGARGRREAIRLGNEVDLRITQLEAENEALWMYYKANCNSDFDLFKEAEKRLKALGDER